jgi:hypothetical protein
MLTWFTVRLPDRVGYVAIDGIASSVVWSGKSAHIHSFLCRDAETLDRGTFTQMAYHAIERHRADVQAFPRRLLSG